MAQTAHRPPPDCRPCLIRQRDVELPAQMSRVCPASRWCWGFADADDGGGSPARPRSGFGLLPNQHVALAVIGAPLGVTDNDGAGAGIAENFRRNSRYGRPTPWGGNPGRRPPTFEPRAFSAKAAISVAGGQTSRSARQRHRGHGEHGLEFGMEAFRRSFPVAGNQRPDGVGHGGIPREMFDQHAPSRARAPVQIPVLRSRGVNCFTSPLLGPTCPSPPRLRRGGCTL